MSNAEFAVAAAIQQRNFVKSIQVLMGICSGLVADGKLQDSEIQFLNAWIHDHPEVNSSWPGNVIEKRVKDILADGIITPEENEDLLSMLQELTGNFFTDTGIAQQDTPALPIDQNPSIIIDGATICFTGKFIFGTRESCELAVTKLGGTPLDNVTKHLDYLVIGSLISPDWINTTYGRKIEKAVTYRNGNGRPIIISEKQWTQSIK